MILVYFQGKPFNSTVIQICAPTIDAKEDEVEQCYRGLQDFLELTAKKEEEEKKKDVLFIIED